MRSKKVGDFLGRTVLRGSLPWDLVKNAYLSECYYIGLTPFRNG